MIYIIPLIMGILSRQAGGGLMADRIWKPLPEILIGLAIGMSFGLPWGLLAAAWSYLWMQSGHGSAFHMGRRPEVAQSGRKQTLSHVIDPICNALNKPLGGKFYCWLFMGLKGTLLSLPLYPYGLIMGILWPLSYELEFQIKERIKASWTGGIDEFISGFLLGCVIVVFLIY